MPRHTVNFTNAQFLRIIFLPSLQSSLLFINRFSLIACGLLSFSLVILRAHPL
jgi:hypothetical protein